VALNVDASGAFGSCVLDGACDGSDAFSALNCFSNQGPEGGPYECVCSGPQPGGPPGQQPPAVARTGISLRAPRTAAPGDLVDVHVHFDDALPDVRGYQLHLDSSGGKGGALQLVDIAVQPDRLGHVFAGLPYFSAFNVRTGQMTAGLETLGVPTPANGYLATFTYRVPLDAAGTFAIELQYDDHQAVPQGRTFLFASPLRKIGVTQASAARLTITAPRERRAQG
jgi:hypothetical protein